ncbi:MAG: LysR family transcriptional regulator [Firmicutes bacterium]|nr:LysR family transcriptional regulator [Bacillota bacterium]
MSKELKNDYFQIIAETRSLSLAAKEVGISQPAMSAYLKKLEKQLGVTLFDRTVLPMKLTREGKAYLDYVNGVSELFDEFQNTLKKSKEE